MTSTRSEVLIVRELIMAFAGGVILPVQTDRASIDVQGFCTMGRRRGNGLLGKIFGYRSSVKYKTDWLGRKQEIVTFNDTGKQNDHLLWRFTRITPRSMEAWF